MSKWILVSESQNAIKYAVQQEQERIIKLLEQEQIDLKSVPAEAYGNIRLTITFLIALIKGEQR